MSVPTSSQLMALAITLYWSVEVHGGVPESRRALAFFDTPHYTSMQLKISTLRVLVRHGWVEHQPAESDKFGREYVWRVSVVGEEILNAHVDVLLEAGREAVRLSGLSALAEVGLAQRRAASKPEKS